MENSVSHPFSLRQLQYAVAVSETLSFSKAAKRCRVSQPSLSAQIALLERALGVLLFERDRRRVLMTEAGKGLIARARQILLEADDILTLARRDSDPLCGTLRIGVIPSISPYLLPSIAPAIHAAYPRLSLVWVEEKTEVLMKSLEAGQLDAALVALEANLGDVDRDIIARDAFVLATSHDDPLGQLAAPAKPRDLRGVHVLLLDDGHCLREQALEFCSKARALEMGFRATSLSTLAQMVARGVGVTLLPELSLPTEERRAHLLVRPFANPAPYRTVALVWRKRSPLAAAFGLLAGVIRACYPASPRQS